MGTPYSAILTLIVTAGVLNVIMGLFVISGKSKLTMVKSFFIFCILAAIYTFGSALEHASGSLEEIKFWIMVEYLGMPFLPPLNLLIIMSYLGMERYLKRGLWIAMFAIPAATLLLVMTNEIHHFYYRDVFLRPGTPYLKADVVAGPWYIIQGAYTFACMFGGVVLLLRGWSKMRSYRFQLGTMLIGLILPLAGDFFYLGGLTPDGMDPIPVIMTITSAFYLWALTSKGLFHVAPIARDNLFTSMRDGVIVLDRNDRLVDYNPEAAAMMPELSAASIGQPLYDLWRLHTDDPIFSMLGRKGNDETTDIQEIQWQSGGAMFNYQIRSSIVRNQGGQEVGRLIVLIDVTERARLQEELRQMAYYDGLTRIYNRAHFIKQSNMLICEAVRSGQPLSFLLFDIDHFKRINDNFGHDIGDQALLHIVAVCLKVLRPDDLFARYGGEEFVIAMPSVTAEAAAMAADRIRAALAAQPMLAPQGLLSITASFGVSAMVPNKGNVPGEVGGWFAGSAEVLAETAAAIAASADTEISGAAEGAEAANMKVSMKDAAWQSAVLQQLLKQADHALYEAKRSGRNTVRIAEPEL
ncbi:histidine kinase N-terminal 7TM domain-containing protein [Paenibacillus sp. GCM10027626]|uniref:histidine kinase N-terminal 7TM domain-containing diguanylate cyclase n=1 Tax=Paenibacillus sp. GCM10027626 TaxID=3273411 RepID=UPI003626CF07